jgi:PAS domain S-box-containing protein
MDDLDSAAADPSSPLENDPSLESSPVEKHQLVTNHSLLAAIVQSSDDAIISKSLDNVITSWNPAAEKLFGYTASEVIGKSLVELIPAEQYAVDEQMTKQIRLEGRGRNYETKRLTKDGRLLDVSLTSSPIRDDLGNLIGVTKVVRDITSRKLDERVSREKDEKYRLALETARIGTWSYDPASSEIVVSPEVRRVYRLPEHLPLDLKIMEDRMHPEDAHLVRAARASAFDQTHKGHYAVEHRIITYEGDEVRWIRVRGQVFFDTEGRAEKLFGTFLDVTEERMATEELERLVAAKTSDLREKNDQLRKSNADLQQFASVASHDLQEPLRKIHSFVDIIRVRSDKETLDAYLEKIALSAGRMSALIRNVLAYSRAGQMRDLVKLVDLNIVLEEIRADYEDLIRAKKGVIKNNELPIVAGVPVQLRQVFANLISNALKFCEKAPEIVVTGRLLSGEELIGYPQATKNIEFAELVFADNGIGFEQEYSDSIFKIFERLHSRREYEGTGIGLALVKKIVENHRGFIKAESSPGNGAVFTVLLPVH